MELEQLKTVWEKTTEHNVEGYFVSKEEVQRLIGKRSNTTISQIKRKIRNKILHLIKGMRRFFGPRT